MHLKSTLMALSAILASSAAALSAQDTDQVVHMDGPGVTAVSARAVAQPTASPLLAQQKKALDQSRAFRPGIYRFRSLHSGLCLTADINSVLVTYRCVAPESEVVFHARQQMFVLPHPGGGYTVRLWTDRGGKHTLFRNERAWQPGVLGNCLTIARGVIFGAPRIEGLPCDASGGDWTSAGALDQRVRILATGPDTVQFALVEATDAQDCWVLRAAGRQDLTEVIRWQCARTPDQLWQAEWLAPLPESDERRLLESAGWYRTPSGHFNILGADGLSLSGTPYNTFETANDGGDYCRKRCAELDQCKAWTWMGPGFVMNSNDPPKCSWYASVGEPINRGPKTFGKLRSGITRP